MRGGRDRPKAVLFDLLTALIDSPRLWNTVAGDAEEGRRWRAAYLAITYGTGAYRPYETLVREAAIATGLPGELAATLAARYGELQPWPEAPAILAALSAQLPLGIVTNCSQALAQTAAARLAAPFAALVSAERAGFYKPHARPYRMALEMLGTSAADTLFVAGSAYDVAGAAQIGMRVFWHDRTNMTAPPGTPAPLARHDRLDPLTALAAGDPP
jgi:2-haloalkanoic acid dehalogenase type II